MSLLLAIALASTRPSRRRFRVERKPKTRCAVGICRGDSFLIVSDVVVEPANSQGELVGFNRTREISGKTASEIATAAKAWGQNDDVTLVTVQSTKPVRRAV